MSEINYDNINMGVFMDMQISDLHPITLSIEDSEANRILTENGSPFLLGRTSLFSVLVAREGLTPNDAELAYTYLSLGTMPPLTILQNGLQQDAAPEIKNTLFEASSEAKQILLGYVEYMEELEEACSFRDQLKSAAPR